MQNKKELHDSKIRFTKPRDEILTVLKEAKTPISLQDIRCKIDESIDLSTIYRTLDLFEKHGIVHKIVYLETGTSVYEYDRHLHVHHLICIECRKIVNVEECPLGDYENRIALETGYQIVRHQLELYGICPECRKSAT
ncbi:Fur family transcriptional regulator [Erysipelothrix larvae]|uniref:Fur family transcriptional regulator n=1 Tax=Erysipelothrix larvae TaxID=1514105 RepID=A0A0X8GXY6_9FIRM|nr:Fur family transcriptional regulator [Erysipelothrix larvae]AMC92480.1 Fur family transcriptional regulator [Erysipelothrix larvae]